MKQLQARDGRGRAERWSAGQRNNAPTLTSIGPRSKREDSAAASFVGR
jgi:hypothetical protein